MKVIEVVKGLFRNVRPKIRLGEEIEVEFSLKEEDKAFEKSLELPQKLAKHTKVVVIFDEFQEVAELGEDVLPKMRAIFQRHTDVCYIFIGSKRGMIEKNLSLNFKSFLQLRNARNS